jgi:uncharacterized RDD family membrane protein YckC
MSYHVARGQEKLGTFTEEEVAERLRGGEFLPTDLCWQPGMGEWVALGDLHFTPARSREEEVNPYLAPKTDGAVPVPVAAGVLAQLSQRLGAAFLDALPMLVMMFLVMSSVVKDPRFPKEPGEMPDPETLSEMVSTQLAGQLGGGMGVLLGMILVINIWWLIKRGQTIGKRIVGIRIVNLTDDRVPPIKNVLFIRSILNGLIASIPQVGALYALVDCLFIFGEQRRCLHDYLARTRVIQGQPVVAVNRSRES